MDPRAYLEMSETESRHWWFVARRKILAGQLNRLIAEGASASILEVGCGTGGNLAMLGKYGHPSAMEKDDTGRAIAMEKAGDRADIRAGSCPDDIPFAPGSFDLICMFDVLEHIDRDVETLRNLSALLKPGGRMLITVPAYRWLWSAHDEFLHHHRRYSATSLKDAIGQSGFVVERLSYFNTLLFPLVAIVRMCQKVTGSQGSSTADVPAPWLNRLLERVFASEASLLNGVNLPFGVSILAVIRPDRQIAQAR